MTDQQNEEIKLTPFQRLINNIDKVKFDCEEKYKEEYKRALFNVLTRLDDYFVKNDLYKCRDYNSIVDDIITPSINEKCPFTFVIHTDDYLKDKPDSMGSYESYSNQISLNPAQMFQGTETEGALCHEFFHFLTRVASFTFSTKNTPSLLILPSVGVKLIRNNTIRYQSIAFNRFLEEGITELSKQQIYSKNEAFYSYPVQTKLVKLMNDLIDDKNFMQVYLTTDLDYYVQFMGEENFKKFQDACNTAFNEIGGNWISLEHNKALMSAHDVIVDVVLNKIGNNKELTARELCEKCAIIQNCQPHQRYNLKIENAIVSQAENKFGNNEEAKMRFIELAFQTKTLFYGSQCGLAFSRDKTLTFKNENNDFLLTDNNLQLSTRLDFNVDKNKDFAFQDGTVHHYNKLDGKMVQLTITNKENQTLASYVYDQELLREQNIIKIKNLGNANNQEFETIDLNEIEKQRTAKIEENLKQIEQLKKEQQLQNERDKQAKAKQELEEEQGMQLVRQYPNNPN